MKGEWRLDFGLGEAAEGYTKVTPATAAYDKERGCGFLNTAEVAFRQREEGTGRDADFCIPFGATFAIDVPDGNYTVALRMGDALAPTETTVRAGDSRPMLRRLRTAAGQTAERSFTVHVTDGSLRLTFSGLAPRLNAMTVSAAPQAMTVFLAGDSTVTDEPAANFPYAGWGMLLPTFFKAEVAIANHATSGRSSRSFIAEGRLEAIVSKMKAGDVLMIQFGHNDQKSDPHRHTEPFTTYKEHLKQYIDAARACGAQPVLVTSVHRRQFDEAGKLVDSHKDYLTAMKELAADEQVPLVDLAEKSRILFEALGPEKTKSLFVWAARGEFMNFPDGVEDNTHFQETGALRIAELVVEGLRELRLLPLTMYLRPSS